MGVLGRVAESADELIGYTVVGVAWTNDDGEAVAPGTHDAWPVLLLQKDGVQLQADVWRDEEATGPAMLVVRISVLNLRWRGTKGVRPRPKGDA